MSLSTRQTYMNQSGIVLMYEHKVRELDSLVLLREYLKNYGLDVEICDAIFTRRKTLLRSKPKIIAVPFLHSNVDRVLIPYKHMYGYDPTIINLHWEQLGTANSQAFLIPKDDFARNVYHVSWSKDFSDFLINHGGVRKELILETGNPKADFLSEKFCGIYTSKAEMQKRFRIPIDSSFYIFVMSFSSAFVDEKYILNVERIGGYKDFRSFIKLSKDSLEKCIEEIRKMSKICKGSNEYIILRPHPMSPIHLIETMVSDIDNIRVSRDFPLHEVIYNSKGVISWLSTGTIDSYILNRPTVILRPIDVPEEYDFELLRGFRKTKNSDETYHYLNTSPVFKNELLDKYVRVIYGDTDGFNTFKLAKSITQMIEENKDYGIFKRKGYWYKVLFEFIYKDIPKKILSKDLTKYIPIAYSGRVDDMFLKNDECVLSKKYEKIAKEIFNEGSTKC